MADFLTTCRHCGKQIIFIRLPSGKNMPCDARPVFYTAPGAGRAMLYTKSGELIRCELTEDREAAAGSAWRPHWSSCADGKGYQRAKQKSSGVGKISPPPAKKPEVKAEKPAEPEYEQASMFLPYGGFRHPD